VQVAPRIPSCCCVTPDAFAAAWTINNQLRLAQLVMWLRSRGPGHIDRHLRGSQFVEC
jgi:hypothetical protein